MESKSDDAPLIVVVGETASGKSALAMQLAEQFDGEIIAADSWTVYRDFDIGTAKPSAEDREKVPHHLLDIADPHEGFSAAVFQRFANNAIADIYQRGKLPILVGGTGLYIDSVLFSYSFLPPSDPQKREELNGLTIDQLLAQITAAGISLDGVDVRNKRRLIRLLENEGQRPERGTLRANTLLLGLRIPREELHKHIERRVDAMFAAGLPAEVEKLAQRYGWEAEPMKGIGYREFQDYYDGTQSLELTRQRIISATLNLAKKQRTWFKRNKSVHWLGKQAESVDLVTTFLNK